MSLLDRINEQGPTLLEQMTDWPNIRIMTQTPLHGCVMESIPSLLPSLAETHVSEFPTLLTLPLTQHFRFFTSISAAHLFLSPSPLAL